MKEKIEIDKQVIESTKCNCGFLCLKDPPGCLCKVTGTAGENLLFVQNREYECNYFVPFGVGGCCNCPTRKEIFRKYHI